MVVQPGPAHVEHYMARSSAGAHWRGRDRANDGAAPVRLGLPWPLAARLLQLAVDLVPGAIFEQPGETADGHAAPNLEGQLQVAVHLKPVPAQEAIFASVSVDCLAKAARQRAIHGAGQCLRLHDLLAVRSERARQRRVVALQGHAELVPFEAIMQRLAAGAETLVVENHGQCPDVVARGSLNFHPRKPKGTVAGNVHDGFVGMGELGPHCRGHRPAHRAGAAEADEAGREQSFIMM